MNKRKHDWKHFSRRTLSLILVLVTLVALCIPTGMALEDNSADEPETVTVQAAEPETEAEAEVAATSETDAQPVAETEPAAEVEQEQVTEPAAEPETSTETDAEQTQLDAPASEPEAVEPVAEPAAPVEEEQTTEPTTEPEQTANEPIEMIDLDGDTDAVELANNDQIAVQGISGDTTVMVGKTVSLTGSSNARWCGYSQSWGTSDSSVATVDRYGTVVGVAVGTAVITHTYCANSSWHYGDNSHTEKTEEITIAVVRKTDNAAMYYLKDPTGNPLLNATGGWAPGADSSSLIAKVDTTNATWVDGTQNGQTQANKNVVSHVADCVVEWPDGSVGSTWTVRRDDSKTGTYFTTIFNHIKDYYMGDLAKKLGISDLQESDVTEITITPEKISRYNGGNNDIHLDCSLDVKCTKLYSAKFWVLEPGADEYTYVDGQNYRKNETVAQTTAATIGSTKTVDGTEYVLTGWYVENAEGGAYGEQVTSWNYRPTDAQLSDGTVNFYARYVPAKQNETVYVYVAGYEIINGQRVRYSDEMLNLLGINPKTIDGNGYFPVGTVEVPKTFFSGKNSPYIQTDADWNTLKNVLANMDVAALTDDGVTAKNTSGTDYNSAYNGVVYTANNNNKVKDYLQYAHGDVGYGSGSMMTALFDWNSKTQWNYGYLNAGQTAKYHLDLRFTTNHITFMYGNNNINDGTKFADGNNAWQDNKEIGSQVYITKSITAAKSAYDHFDVPEGYTWDGKFYKDAYFTEEYNDNEIFSISIEQNYDVYLKLTKKPGTLVINKTINPSKWMTTEELDSLKNSLTFTATNTVTGETEQFVGEWNGNTFVGKIENLPGDSTWTVSETGEKMAYVTCATTITYENGADHATVPKGGTATVYVTNTYTDDLVNLTISKTVKGNNKTPGSFTFVATNERTGISYTVTIVGKGEETIYDIPAGIYTVTELENDNFEIDSESNRTQEKEITEKDTVVDFSYTNNGTGDSYQYSSSVVNKGEVNKDGTYSVKFAQIKNSTTNN